jgi:Zn-dependent peptidase ImmA (M78 family)
MTPSNSDNLNEVQIETIRKLADELRRNQGFMAEVPIANDIYTILEQLGITLLEYPIKANTQQRAFSAALFYSEIADKEIICLGVNTNDYFDRQIFAIAHELYHFITKNGSHLSRLSEESEQSDPIEILANRFAAEFLLPAYTLKSLILEEFLSSSLEKISLNALLRFTARIQCTWWLPFKSIVKRFLEIEAISENTFNQIYSINCRNIDETYGRIGQATNNDVFTKLNSMTRTTGTSPKGLEIIIRNFEDGFISEDAFQSALSLFNKKPGDFGYAIEISEEDILEFSDILNQDVLGGS